VSGWATFRFRRWGAIPLRPNPAPGKGSGRHHDRLSAPLSVVGLARIVAAPRIQQLARGCVGGQVRHGCAAVPWEEATAMAFLAATVAAGPDLHGLAAAVHCTRITLRRSDGPDGGWAASSPMDHHWPHLMGPLRPV
jgi:hypothetical protein